MAASDATVKIFDLASGEKENELKHDDEVLDLCFDNNKDCLLSACSDCSWRIWQ